MKITKLILQTAYLKTLEEFYSSVLELPVKPINEKEIIIKIGNSDLIFTEAKEREPFYHFAINIPSDKIEDAKTWLSNKVQLLWMEDYKSEIADFVNWHAKSVYFFDPAGNILELIARFDLKNESNESFSPKQLLSVNEVGLVFKQEEFDQKTAQLLSLHSLSYFSKQPPLPQFRAVGDDEGLFVIVPEYRNWFPTNKPAEIFPINIEFGNPRNDYTLTLN
jgi:hypothetical protein